jgi:2-oxoisovalerate dehydrogenase E2 component (dihydrolipoyl transacylase)
MSMTRVTMPQLGESVHEGTIAKWLVKPGDKVVEFEPMVEVDTDKVSAEVPAPVTGVLKEIIAKEGETVQAGAEIAVVEVDGDSPGEEAKPKPKATPEPKAKAEPEPEPEPEPAPKAAAPKAAAPREEPRPAPKPAAAPAPAGGEHRFSPAVTMLADEKGVDLGQVPGTGIGGRVTKRDVRQFLESGARPAAVAAPGRSPAPPVEKVAAGEGDEVVPLTRIRKLIAENMTRSKATIPHAWQTQEVDMSGVVAHRNANKGAFQQREGFSLTYLPYVIAATTAALREHPQVNATFNDTELLVHRDVNIGVSIGLEDTLVVPVIRRADGLSLAGIARAVNELAQKARNKKLSADDLTGGTFTVNNSGTFGTLFSYSVINPGQAGILTMEAIVERPVAVNGMIGIKPLMYACFSFDHRILDGLAAARFLVSCRKWLEEVSTETPLY